ncbi:hypothetical protein ACHAWF_003155 [Thalassiosira exigua]
MALSPSYALGLSFLAIVSVLWTACSIIVRHLYADLAFDSPFLLVYVGTSLFSAFLPARLAYERWGRTFAERCGRRPCCCGDGGGEGDGGKREVPVVPWRNDATAPRGGERLVRDGGSGGGSDFELPDVPIPGYRDAPDDDGDFPNEDERGVCGGGGGGDGPPPPVRSEHYLLSHVDHLSMASRIAPLWFGSNYLYALSLEWTSIASSTVLASTGSVFAFGFATRSRFGDEAVTWGKLLGVALCFLGGSATAWSDGKGDGGAGDVEGSASSSSSSSSPARSSMGDLAGLLSAVGYGAYTVLLRHVCPKDEGRMSMQLLFGYVGLLNMVILLPFGLWAGLSGEPPNPSEEGSSDNGAGDVHKTLTGSIFLFLVLKGLLDNVLSDYLWARAVLLTSATVASVGVGLTIPMAFFADWIMGEDRAGSGEVWGAAAVLLGFVFVNVGACGREGGEGEEGEAEELDFVGEIGAMDGGSSHDAEIIS